MSWVNDILIVYSVVCVGGDGTFNELFNGLLHRQMKAENNDMNDLQLEVKPLDTTIAVIPAG